MKYLLTLALVPILSFSASLLTAEEETAETKKNKAWETIDSAEFAEKLDAATAAGEKWAEAPESIGLEFAGPFITESGEKMGQRRTIGIRSKGEGVPGKLSVTLIDDGLFDDSIKKQSSRLVLKRKENGDWKLVKILRRSEKWAPPA